MRWSWIALLGLTACRSILGFEEPVVIDAAPDAAPDAFTGCLTNANCSNPTPVCEARTCVGCRIHSDCTSGACLPDGACADAAQVAYVSPTGAGNLCSAATPCGTLNYALQAQRPIIKFGLGTVADVGLTMIDNRTITIVAEPGSVLDRTDDGTILEVRGPANVTIVGLQITGLTGVGAAISLNSGIPRLRLVRVAVYGNSGLGLTATVGHVTIERSIFASNLEGGAIINGAGFAITNSMFVRNGSSASTFGGLSLYPSSSTAVFEFNTVANNAAVAGNATGINCNGGVYVRSTIIAANSHSTVCGFFNSLFDTVPQSGGMNVMGNPAFRNTLTGPNDPAFYRIYPTSAAIDRANGTATVDIDGEARPKGAGRDIGADEAQ